MKKIVLLFLTLFIISCSNDSSNSESETWSNPLNDVVGTWRISAMERNGAKLDILPCVSEFRRMIFFYNNNLTFRSAITENDGSCRPTESKSKYTYDKQILVIQNYDSNNVLINESTYKIIDVTSNSLIITYIKFKERKSDGSYQETNYASDMQITSTYIKVNL